MMKSRYDRIGQGYAKSRRQDPDVFVRILAALGNAQSVVNVGAGTGSYEPTDRHVIAVEPSDVMATQRPLHRVPAVRAFAQALPLRSQSVDASMTVMSLHHWEDGQERGLLEMRRVARGVVWWFVTDATNRIRAFECASLYCMGCPKVMILSAAFLAFACNPEPKKPTTPVPTPVGSTYDASLVTLGIDAGGDATNAASVPTRTVSLVGKAPTKVPESDLSAHISGSSHKSRAPVADVSILVSQGEKKAELTWRITSGEFDGSWLAIAGRRWDDATNTYVDGEILGWQARLESVDDQSAGGNPTAITISFRPTP